MNYSHRSHVFLRRKWLHIELELLFMIMWMKGWIGMLIFIKVHAILRLNLQDASTYLSECEEHNSDELRSSHLKASWAWTPLVTGTFKLNLKSDASVQEDNSFSGVIWNHEGTVIGAFFNPLIGYLNVIVVAAELLAAREGLGEAFKLSWFAGFQLLPTLLESSFMEGNVVAEFQFHLCPFRVLECQIYVLML